MFKWMRTTACRCYSRHRRSKPRTTAHRSYTCASSSGLWRKAFYSNSLRCWTAMVSFLRPRHLSHRSLCLARLGPHARARCGWTPSLARPCSTSTRCLPSLRSPPQAPHLAVQTQCSPLLCRAEAPGMVGNTCGETRKKGQRTRHTFSETLSLVVELSAGNRSSSRPCNSTPPCLCPWKV